MDACVEVFVATVGGAFDPIVAHWLVAVNAATAHTQLDAGAVAVVIAFCVFGARRRQRVGGIGGACVGWHFCVQAGFGVCVLEIEQKATPGGADGEERRQDPKSELCARCFKVHKPVRSAETPSAFTVAVYIKVCRIFL